MTIPYDVSKYSFARNLSAALGVICLVIAGEYFFRHYVLFWLPTFGTLVVNDMFSLFLVYSLLIVGSGLITQVNWGQEVKGIARELRESLSSWEFTFWLMILILSMVLLSRVDQFLWGKFALPMFISSYRNPTVLLAGCAPFLEVVSRLFVNGFFVPIAEEYIWRGFVQVRFLRIFPIPVAIGLTAVIFSLKHAIVDASLGRLLSIMAFGIICGVVAQRSNWRRSAALHVFANTAATLAAILFGLG